MNGWHTPLAQLGKRQPQPSREDYEQAILAAVPEIVAAVRDWDGPGLASAVDRALALPPSPGEDPVHWLAAALAMRAVEAGQDVRRPA